MPARSEGIAGTGPGNGGDGALNTQGSRKIGLGVLAAAVLLAGLVLWYQATAAAPVVGRRAPDFTVDLLAGDTVSLNQFRGRPVILNFWATWCPPCVEELPAFQRVVQEGRAEVLAVNVGETGEEAADFLRRLGVDLPVALDGSGDLLTRYRVLGLPQTFFIDAGGVIRHVERGALSYDEVVAILEQIRQGGA